MGGRHDREGRGIWQLSPRAYYEAPPYVVLPAVPEALHPVSDRVSDWVEGSIRAHAASSDGDARTHSTFRVNDTGRRCDEPQRPDRRVLTLTKEFIEQPYPARVEPRHQPRGDWAGPLGPMTHTRSLEPVVRTQTRQEQNPYDRPDDLSGIRNPMVYQSRGAQPGRPLVPAFAVPQHEHPIVQPVYDQYLGSRAPTGHYQEQICQRPRALQRVHTGLASYPNPRVAKKISDPSDCGPDALLIESINDLRARMERFEVAVPRNGYYVPDVRVKAESGIPSLGRSTAGENPSRAIGGRNDTQYRGSTHMAHPRGGKATRGSTRYVFGTRTGHRRDGSPGGSDSGSETDNGLPNRRPVFPPTRRTKRPGDYTSDPSEADEPVNSVEPDKRRRIMHVGVSPVRERPNPKSYLKLRDFDGRTCVEAFLAKFEICARHNGWSEADRLENLQCALTGNAAQMLWDQGSEGMTSSRRLIRHLRSRFGSEDQQVLHRTLLRTRVRPKGETLSETVDEIRRLMALAYPGRMSSDKQTIAIDALLRMMGDGELALKIREIEPNTLDEALRTAVRLEAYQSSNSPPECLDKRTKLVRVVTDTNPSQLAADLGTLMKEYHQLQSEKLDRLFESLKQSQTAVTAPALKTQDGNFQARPFAGRRRPPREPSEGGKCYNCGLEGHFSRNCQLPKINRETIPTTASGNEYPIPTFVSPAPPGLTGPSTSQNRA